jgi:hypothetical protein
MASLRALPSHWAAENPQQPDDFGTPFGVRIDLCGD